MTLPTCALYIDSTERAVETMVYRWRIPFVRQNGRLYFDRLEIDRWMYRGRRKPPRPARNNRKSTGGAGPREPRE
jgi:hypothetical protein